MLQGCMRLDVFHFAELPKNWRYQGKNTWNSSYKLAKENLLSKINFKACGASEEDLLTLQYKPPQKKNNVKHVWLTEDSHFYSDGKAHLKQGYCLVASKDHLGLLLRN